MTVPADRIAALRRPDRELEGYIFDLDGTITLGEALLPGAAELIATLTARGRKTLFLSNNPTRTSAQYAAKLARLGISVSPEMVLNTVDTMTAWLRRDHPGATVFPIGERPLVDALAAAGIRMSDDPAEIDLVIASYDRTFDYRKLQIAFDAIRTYGRAQLVATHPDRFCPFPGGRGEPDAAAIIGAIEGCTGATLLRHTGKPDPFMLEAALGRLGLPADACLMTGDRLTTDIRMGIDAGMPTTLVLTGETSLAMVSALPEDAQPTWVVERVDHVLPARTGHGATT